MHVLVNSCPRLRFVLVDPAPFTMKPLDIVSIVQDLFSDELARNLAAAKEGKGQVWFISDIRTADPDIHAPAESVRSMLINQTYAHQVCMIFLISELQ
jgi:hypothetical protein